ncbi:MAG TPA: GTP-binding protein [archaeon]|nr:GTP-binding protein [archaeon]
MGIPEKIEAIQKDLHRTQVNKHTERYIGIQKAKIAKLKREEEADRNRGGGSSLGYAVKKSGDATVVLIGLPNVGKSTLLNRLTNTKSKVAAYQFTTLTVVPGMMEYKGARIQILDLPGIINGASSGKGLGKRVLSVVRSADLILFIVEAYQPETLSILKEEVRNIGIRPDERQPRLTIEKTDSDGILVNTLVKMTKMTVDTVKKILQEFDIHNAMVMINEDASYDQLIDVLLQNCKYVPTVTVMNKIDLVPLESLNEIKSKINYSFIPISADANLNIDQLKEKIYEKMGFIRVFMRPKGGETDYEKPMILKNNASVLDVCNKVHRGMKNALHYAQISGKSVKYSGQKVGITHHVMDGDVITLVTKEMHEQSRAPKRLRNQSDNTKQFA